MAANNVLDKQIPIYHRFVDNQVLTDDQLNEVLDHINFQDKLTRTGLIGVGIVCGLQLKTTATTIRLGKGIAVTTDGDLLKKGDTIYRGFKNFKDEKVKYGHFLEDDEVIDLYELEEDTAPTDVFALNQFQTRTGIAKDRMVALLYLENFLKEEEDCSPVDCNAQGREVANNLRVLITSLDMAKTIAEKDSIFAGLLTTSENDVLNKIDTYFSKRVVVNGGVSSSIGSLKNAYTVQFDGLFNRISQLGEMNIFKSLVGESGVDLRQTPSKLKPQDLNFQYIYDFYKDLATAYNELLTAVRKQYTICCPNPLAFPKHVLLGEVYNSPTYLRHQFYPSPIHNDKGSLAHLQGLFVRIMHMIKYFLVTTLKEVRITPSRNNAHPLGQRALPYYYNLSVADGGREMINSWDIDQEGLTLNYYKAGYKTDFEPLEHCLDDHDFYRIEGHVGQEVTEVVKNLQNIRAQRGLAFDIMPIAIGVAADDVTLDYDKYNMYFEDLQVILQAWNEEQKCLISGSSKFLTRFSAVTKGAHLDYLRVVDESEFTATAGTTPATALAALDLGATRAVAATKSRGVARAKTNTVLETMDKSEGSLGGLYTKELKASDGGSDFQVKIDGAIKDTIKDWEKEIQVAVAEIPGDLLGKLKVSEDNKLIDIEDFTEENLAKYIEALKAQCTAAQQAKKNLQTQVNKKDSALQGVDYLENYFFVLNRIISSCCLVERVKVLYEKIIERKQELLGKMILKEYVKAHPGVEHKAGVERGGTFVVLYFSNLKPKTVSATTRLGALDLQANLKRSLVLDDSLFLEKTIADKNRLILEDLQKKGLVAFEDQPGNLKLFTGGLSTLGARATFNVSHKTVIGDVCLPYICCTDMPATTFVFPDQEVNLFIGKDHVCVPFDGQGEQVLMEVTPVDGTVTAHDGDTLLPDTIIKKNDNFFFEPNMVPESVFGKTITFKVNGQNVSEELKVLRQPKASFTVNENVTLRNDNTIAEITVKNTSQPIAGQKFIWDFGQGDSIEQNATEFKHAYQVKPGGTFTFDITLTAENSSCTDTATQKKVIIVPKSGEDPQNCQLITESALINGRKAIDVDLEKNPSDLKEAKVFYEREFKPQYDLLFKDMEATLKGSIDTEIYQGIEKIQKAVTERLRVNLSAKEQEFLLRLYYENMLIYFYVQACRDSNISAKTPITKDWEAFTENAVDSFRVALQSLLKIYPVFDKLREVRTKEDARLSTPLKKTLDTILQILKKFIG